MVSLASESDHGDGAPVREIGRLDEFVRALPESFLQIHDDDLIHALRTVYARRPDIYAVYRPAIRAKGGLDLLRLVEKVVTRVQAESVKLPDPIDLLGWSDPPAPPRHIVADWLPEGEVTLFAGHGGSGKSAIALDLACCLPLGLPWNGLEVQARDVCFVSCEDSAEVLHWRVSRNCRHRGIEMADLAGGLQIVDLTAIDPELMVARDDEPTVTALYEALAARVEPNSVTIIDGASDTFGGQEINRRHVRRFIRALRQLAGKHGAVLLLTHIDKAAARSKDSGDRYSGSTAWHNSVRARWELTADGDELVLKLAKANHAQRGQEIRLTWDADAHMHVPVAAQAERGVVEAIRDRQQREGLLAAFRACTEAVPSAMTGPRTAWHVLQARPELPAVFRDARTGKRQFWAEIERLRQMGLIIETSIRRGNRHFTSVLTLVS